MSNDLHQLARLTRHLRDQLAPCVTDHRRPTVWSDLAQQFAGRTGLDDATRMADEVAQAVTCAVFACRSLGEQGLTASAIGWLIAQAEPLLQHTLELSLLSSSSAEVGAGALAATAEIDLFLTDHRISQMREHWLDDHAPHHAGVYFYEQFLRSYNRQARHRHGVFYTPFPVVTFMVRSVDQLLRDEFRLPDGMADTGRETAIELPEARNRSSQSGARDAGPLSILDPALGTGAFLLQAIEVIRQTVFGHMSAGSTRQQTLARWDEYVQRHLLTRIRGFELMLAPLLLAHLQLAGQLARSGYRFRQPGKLQLRLGNVLQRPDLIGEGCRPGEQIEIVMGNPPFAGVSRNSQRWIKNLLHGQSPTGGKKLADYFRVDGVPLGERKHWLEDDYVKFMRLAHWQVEKSGTGIVAFITNHGFLGNLTFRGMRQQLLATFPRVTLIDLHGNKRSGEQCPEGGTDEGVFPIEQGVVVSLLRRPGAGPASRVEYGELWGRRSDKLQTLEHSSMSALEAIRIEPRAPHYFLVPRNDVQAKEYGQGYRIADIMPLHSTAAVTARDPFVVAFDDDELRTRLDLFRDRNVPDRAVRERYFRQSRSPRYAPGDTRGWSLSEARRRMADLERWPDHLRDCLYRPFDRRRIFWATWMIDWPRHNVMRHLEDGANLALIARRQTPSTQPCDYFWITDTIALDGLIRSDNRGSESVFPLYVTEQQPKVPGQGERFLFDRLPTEHSRRANFSPPFVTHCQRKLGIDWVADGISAAPHRFGPDDLFFFIYGLFFSGTYRQRYASCLRIDFPRVFVPRQPTLFWSLSGLGRQLADAHLLRGGTTDCDWPAFIGQSSSIDAGYPKWMDQAVWVNATSRFYPVREAAWQFRAGTYQVCRKWLRDRRQRGLHEYEQRRYCQILAAISRTLELSAAIDQQIEASGGWPQAFGLG